VKNSNTTRYLCAAAQLNRGFRTQVLNEIVNEDHRVISIPAGVDLLAVIRHCLNAKRRKIIRNIIVSFLFLIAWVSAYKEISYYDPFLAFFLSIFRSYSTFYFFLAWIVVAVETWITRYQIIAKSLLHQNYNPSSVALLPETEAKIRRKLSDVIDEEKCNTIIYSGFTPFVGAGIDVGGWSFTLNIGKGKEKMGNSLKPKPFTIEELYSRVESDIEDLHLEGVRIQDKIFINGQDICGDSRFLPDPFRRPLTQLNISSIKEFIKNKSDKARYYKSIRVEGWQGEIILSGFLRFLKLRQNLFTEVSFFLLTPLKEEYRNIDKMQPNLSWRKVVQLIFTSFMKTSTLFVYAIFLLIGEIIEPITNWRKRRASRQLIRENPMFDYGAVTSIRELASSKEYRHYFQKLDREMFIKIVERQILDSITNFFDEHDIDTSDLQARQDAILNNGVIVTGGSVEAQNLTVGDKARSVMNNMAQTVSSATGGGQSKTNKK
jgi:hypothetical protein